MPLFFYHKPKSGECKNSCFTLCKTKYSKIENYKTDVHGCILILAVPLYLVSIAIGLPRDVVGEDFINTLLAH